MKRVFSTTTAAFVAAIGFLPSVAAPRPIIHDHDHDHDSNACDSTAQSMRQSCRYEKRSDHMRAVANCRNLPSSERSACLEQAVEDLHDGLQECEAEFHKRREVCDLLGGGIYDPAIDPSRFVRSIDNPHMPLVPGTTLVYEGQTAKGLAHDEFHVLPDTREILGVTCTTVHDTTTLDGQLSEDTLDWFAQDVDGNVWYFGENSHIVEDGLVVSLEGSWTAGQDGAKPGIVMHADADVGHLYREEFALGTAEDVARVIAVHQSITVHYGTFADCWKTEGFSALEPAVVENKFFAPGVGSVMEIDLDTGEFIELTEIRHD
jgi:hypothetical protein